MDLQKFPLVERPLFLSSGLKKEFLVSSRGRD